jgi:hypothetical protein
MHRNIYEKVSVAVILRGVEVVGAKHLTVLVGHDEESQ